MPCHPESRAAIGFLANTFQVNRTVLIWSQNKHCQAPPGRSQRIYSATANGSNGAD
jgi:hypothetical protein